MKTRVVHCKKEKYDIYIGRPSIWGNPYKLGVDGGQLEVLEKFKAYMESRLQNPDTNLDLKSLQGKVLGCWCHPLPCHGDILAELADDNQV